MQFSLFDDSNVAGVGITPVVSGLAAGAAGIGLAPTTNEQALNAQLQNIPLKDGQLHMLPQWLSAGVAGEYLAELSASLAWQQSMIKLYGQSRLIPRLNAWYGDPEAHYQYSGLNLQPLPWTPALLQLRAAIEQTLKSLTSSSDLNPRPLNSVLTNLYRDERDSVAWHSDDEPELGPQPLIVSLSLGAARRFSLKHKRIKGERCDLMLTSGSLLIMSGATQQYWQHALLKQTLKSGPRINLTFRHIV
jgi:alkylated DNA repair dioxygenase AlkB